MTAAHAGIGAEGAVVSNAEDTARFLVALMQGKLLGPEQLELMKTSGFWSGGDPTGCGGVAYGHSGGGAAFKTNVWVSGDGRRVAVLLLNGRGDAAADVRAGAAMTRLYCAAVAESGHVTTPGPPRLRRRRGRRRAPHGHGRVRRARAGCAADRPHRVRPASRWCCSQPPSAGFWLGREGLRAVLALVLGVLALEGFALAVADARAVGVRGDDWTGFALAPAGLALVALGLVLLWRSRKRARPPAPAAVADRGRRCARRLLGGLARRDRADGDAPAPRGRRDGRPRTRAQPVTLRTSDGLDLRGRYVTSRNGAAVIVFPGSVARAGQARALVRHGYGVLMLDMRGYCGQRR